MSTTEAGDDVRVDASEADPSVVTETEGPDFWQLEESDEIIIVADTQHF